MTGEGTSLSQLLGRDGLTLVRGDVGYPLDTVGEPACTAGCPAGVDVKAYVTMIMDKRYAEAIDIIRLTNPLPSVCGRVCFHPCEGECLYAGAGEAVSIRALKRHASEMDASRRPVGGPPFPRTHSERVAVVGSGPSGLAAATDLARMGYGVTVYEKLEHGGGMMHMYIPSYRLPRRILENDLEWIESRGVEFCMGEAAPSLDRLRDEYDAVVLAVGTHRSIRLGIEGEGADGVLDPLDLLYRAKHGGLESMEGRTIVIGGGNTAVDCARTAARLGSKSSIYYRRSMEEMPASGEEVRETQAEGVKIHTLAIPVRVITDGGKVSGMEFLRAELGEPDESGRRRPVPVEGSGFTVEAEHVVPAIGQRSDADQVAALGLEVEPRGTARVDDRCMTSVDGVFAAGDLITGPTSVVDTIGHAHDVAWGVDSYLRGTDPVLVSPVKQFSVSPPEAAGAPATPPGKRQDPPMQPVETRHGITEEVEGNYAEWAAVSEAARCHRCGSCYECAICLPLCPTGQVYMEAQGRGAIVKVPAEFPVDLGGEWSVRTSNGTALPVRLYPVTAEVDADKCIACGRCEEVCPYDVARVGFTRDAGPACHIDPLSCRGCSACVGACPTGAIRQGAFSLEALADRIARAAGEGPGAVALVCHWGLSTSTFDSYIGEGIVDVQSVQGLGPSLITGALAHGARGVLILQCPPGGRHFLDGERTPEELTEAVKDFLRAAGLGAERVSYADMKEGDRPGDLLARFIRGLDAGGVRPLPAGALPETPAGATPFAHATGLLSRAGHGDPWSGPRPAAVDSIGRAFGAGDMGGWRESLGALRTLTGKDAPSDVMEAAAAMAEKLGGGAGTHGGAPGLWSSGGVEEAPKEGSPQRGRRVLAVLCGGDDCAYVCSGLGRLPEISLTRLPAPGGLTGPGAWERVDREARGKVIALLEEARTGGARTVVAADPDLLSVARALNRRGGWQEVDVEAVDPFTYVLGFLADRGVRAPAGWSGKVWGGDARE